ncbi:MAG: PaaX family transcriptional regulator C-terminal domain-containing protein [Paracoccaceae bacterium]
MTTTLAHPLSELLDAVPLKAAGFIVTLYGDVVVPRGGEVWMGSIIDACARVGISETLVRTAVSRLVASGQLEGDRRGRRSFYRLSQAATAEFDAAAGLIYGPPDPCGMRFVYLPDAGADLAMAQLERRGFARLKPQIAVGPDRGPLPEGCLVFEGQIMGDRSLLAGFVAQTWNLSPHRMAYEAFLRQFTPLVPAARALAPDEALTARLLLVHAWRLALLRDPRLPAEALPADWPGDAARSLFARLYLALSPQAESRIEAMMESGAGPLPGTNPQTRARHESLGSLWKS